MISKAKVENYFLLLSIIENNLLEYSSIVEQLREIQAEVKETNNIMKGNNEGQLEDDFELPIEGDALSTLIRKKTRTGR
jgi:hypothetical protein